MLLPGTELLLPLLLQQVLLVLLLVLLLQVGQLLLVWLQRSCSGSCSRCCLLLQLLQHEVLLQMRRIHVLNLLLGQQGLLKRRLCGESWLEHRE